MTETNKSRVAYIESEMAKRRLAQALAEASNLTPNPHSPDEEESDPDPDPTPAPNPNPSGKPTVQRQPAALGKIHEIDLGTAAALRNQKRTELAIRRARGEVIPPEHPPVVKKPRLGRNGKPRRGPKRRNSEDVQRDQLVEQVLHESRRKYTPPGPFLPTLTTIPPPSVEIYNEPSTSQTEQAAASAAAAKGDEEDTLNADDRVAEQFRQDFLDAMQARRRHRSRAQPKSSSSTLKPAEPQVPRGPKLGGSRAARAAMRQLQLKELKKK